MNTRFRKFFSYYRPYRRKFFLVLLCAAIASGLSLLFPLCVRYVTETVLAQPARDLLMRGIAWAAAAMLGITLLRMGFEAYYDYRGHSIGAQMERDMRSELFAHLERLSFSFYDERRTGDLMSRLTNDLLGLTELYHHGPEDLTVYVIRFVGAMAILSAINVRLTLVVLAILLVMAGYAVFFTRRMRRATARSQQRIAEVNSQAEDSLGGIRTVQSFVGEAREWRKFGGANQRFADSRKEIYWNETVCYQGTVTFAQLIIVVVAALGGWLIAGGALGVPDLVAYLLYASYLTEPVERLIFVIGQYQEGLAGFGRFMEMIETQPEVRERADARPLASVRGEIEFQDVSFRYGTRREAVLQGVNLQVQAREYVALVGASGVGKTTLCSLIPRFYDVTEGAVLLDGRDVRALPLQFLREQVGFVQQDVYLFAGTVRENILYGRPDASEAEMVEAARKADAHEFIVRLPDGYDTDVGQRGTRLSGGQKQRIGIARVFLKNPRILVLDEATGSLDYESERSVQKALEAVAVDRTTVVIAHRLSTIRNARRILVLSEAGIAEQGTHEQLMALGGLYAALYQAQ